MRAINQNRSTNDNARREQFVTIKATELQNQILRFTVVNNKAKYLHYRELAIIFILLEWAYRFKDTPLTMIQVEDICAVAGVFLCTHAINHTEETRISTSLLRATCREIAKQNNQFIEPVKQHARSVGFKIKPEQLKGLLQEGSTNNQSLRVSSWHIDLCAAGRRKEEVLMPYREILARYNDLEAEINHQPINANPLFSYANANDSTAQIIRTLQQSVPIQPPEVTLDLTQITPTFLILTPLISLANGIPVLIRPAMQLLSHLLVREQKMLA